MSSLALLCSDHTRRISESSSLHGKLTGNEEMQSKRSFFPMVFHHVGAHHGLPLDPTINGTTNQGVNPPITPTLTHTCTTTPQVENRWNVYRLEHILRIHRKSIDIYRTSRYTKHLSSIFCWTSVKHISEIYQIDYLSKINRKQIPNPSPMFDIFSIWGGCMCVCHTKSYRRSMKYTLLNFAKNGLHNRT